MANSSAAGVATIAIDSWTHPFSRKTLAALGALLPDFLAGRRWFRAKARSIRETAVEDVLEADGAWILLLQVGYTDGGSDRYLAPVGLARTQHVPPECREIVASVTGPGGESGVLYGALFDPAFRRTLLRAIAQNSAFNGWKGELVAQPTQAFEESMAAEKLESSLVKAEQSNSSIVYGDRCILKLFRKLEPGLNPDAEIGIFLTERGFRYTPDVLGTLEYRTPSAAYSVGILQRFVKNRGDTWAFALESLNGFFDQVTTGAYAPVPKTFHPLDLARESPPAELQELLGPFASKVPLLAQRTAEMHAALCDSAAGPDFAPEPFTREASAKAHAEMQAQADIAFGLMRRKQAELPPDVGTSARELLRLEHRVAEHFARFRDYPVGAYRIRHHGDFHLGQVLYTGEDFLLIDFEGEPSRPLEDRRAKALALRDVAGMIRSFQYAAYAALFAAFPDAAAQQDVFPLLESWAVSWSAWMSAFYAGAYFAAAKDAFAGASGQERRVVLDTFLLEKALYEIGYEWNNRPDWVRIPLRGALGLIR
ncbi:MAG: putative maltokinase [Bryobacteraceae bacterium]